MQNDERERGGKACESTNTEGRRGGGARAAKSQFCYMIELAISPIRPRTPN